MIFLPLGFWLIDKQIFTRRRDGKHTRHQS